jgi:hypothetical protein
MRELWRHGLDCLFVGYAYSFTTLVPLASSAHGRRRDDERGWPRSWTHKALSISDAGDRYHGRLFRALPDAKWVSGSNRNSVKFTREPITSGHAQGYAVCTNESFANPQASSHKVAVPRRPLAKTKARWRNDLGDFSITLNQRVAGSSPATPTNKINHLELRYVPQESRCGTLAEPSGRTGDPI